MVRNSYFIGIECLLFNARAIVFDEIGKRDPEVVGSVLNFKYLQNLDRDCDLLTWLYSSNCHLKNIRRLIRFFSHKSCISLGDRVFILLIGFLLRDYFRGDLFVVYFELDLRDCSRLEVGFNWKHVSCLNCGGGKIDENLLD